MIDCRKIGTFIENTIVGCKFVGVSSEGELFVEFEHDDDSFQLNAAELLRSEFPEIVKVIIVGRVNVKQAKEMVEQLNRLLRKEPDNLLNIESF